MAESNFSIMTGTAMQNLTGLDLGGFTTNKQEKLAQREYNPKTAISEVKVPSAGKPLNNNDPYPVDLKIEELENHLPRVKQYSLPYSEKHDHGFSKKHAEAILGLSDYCEKRLVRLENILATVLRYVFGIGSRMFINCQYWGGTDKSSKYTCIKCLRDDRIGDGQVMQLDQCLSCSRYEPIIGATYDLLNEVGVNLANIQDDIQMGYMNMEDYLEFTRTEKMHTPKKDVKLSTATAKIRNRDEKDFKDQWDAGVKMKWDYVPVENQKAQINWRQDINSADKSPAKLSSQQQRNGLGGTGIIAKSTITPGKSSDYINKTLQSIQGMKNK